jgi:dihydroorotase
MPPYDSNYKMKQPLRSPDDLTIFDPELPWTYDLNRSFSKSRNSPFDGGGFRGGHVATIVDDLLVWHWG